VTDRPDSLPDDPHVLGWKPDWYKLVLARDDARRAFEAAGPGERYSAEWDVDKAEGALRHYEEMVAAELAWALRQVARFSLEAARLALAPVVGELVTQQTDPEIAALRGKVKQLERRLKRLEDGLELYDAPKEVGREEDS